MKTSAYLARLATAQGVFRALHEAAMGLLPPAQPARTTPEPIEAHVTLAALATKLAVSPTVIRAEITRLVNFGWVSKEAPGRFRLGARHGAEVTLLADVQAQEVTGQARLISGQVLRRPADVATPPGADSVRHETPRGAGRTWER